MIKHSRPFVAAIGILLLPLVINAQGDAGDTQKDFVDRIFHEMALAQRLDERPRDLHQQFSQNPLGLPPEKNERMMELFLQAFTSDTLQAYARENFLQDYKSGAAEEVESWIGREHTQKVLQAEQQFYSLQGMRKRIVHQYEMEQNPPPESRSQLIDQLIESRSAIESEVESQLVLFRALITAFGEVSEQRSFTEAQIDGFVDNYRGQLQMQVERELPRQFMLMYYEVETDTLNRYISFFESDAGSWLSGTTSESIQSAYQQATDRFLESIRNE